MRIDGGTKGFLPPPRFWQREVDHEEDRKDRAWDLMRGERVQIPKRWRAL